MVFYKSCVHGVRHIPEVDGIYLNKKCVLCFPVCYHLTEKYVKFVKTDNTYDSSRSLCLSMYC